MEADAFGNQKYQGMVDYGDTGYSAGKEGKSKPPKENINLNTDFKKIFARDNAKIAQSKQANQGRPGPNDPNPHYGMGIQFSIALGFTKGVELSVGAWSSGPGTRGQYFITFGQAKSKKVYMNAGGSAQIEFLRSRSGPIDVTGMGKSYSIGIGDYSGAYSQNFDAKGNVSADVIGGGLGGGLSPSAGLGVDTKTWTLDFIAPILITPLLGFGRR
jgi:hypothetical protein